MVLTVRMLAAAGPVGPFDTSQAPFQLTHLEAQGLRLLVLSLLGVAVLMLFKHRNDPSGAFKTFLTVIMVCFCVAFAISPTLLPGMVNGLANLGS